MNLHLTSAYGGKYSEFIAVAKCFAARGVLLIYGEEKFVIGQTRIAFDYGSERVRRNAVIGHFDRYRTNASRIRNGSEK